ncbi:uncharacterized protein [Parasteatoda tepidariorum]|uniref:uncharacterized protein n=1 Tax=Parasteatoda tepidariorum TaxID=114398 RepID=UPI0039BD83FE
MTSIRFGRGGKVFRPNRVPAIHVDLDAIRKESKDHFTARLPKILLNFDKEFANAEMHARNIDDEIESARSRKSTNKNYLENCYRVKFHYEEMLSLKASRDNKPTEPMLTSNSVNCPETPENQMKEKEPAAEPLEPSEPMEPEMTTDPTANIEPTLPEPSPDIITDIPTEPETESPAQEREPTKEENTEPPKKKRKRKKKNSPTTTTDSTDIPPTANIPDPVASPVEETTEKIQPEILHKNSRNLKFLIKGLPSETKISVLEENLTAIGHRPIRVEQFKKRRDEGYKLLLLFLIILPDSPMHRDCINIKEILHTTVQIERFRGGRYEVQCFRCQKFGHTQKNCTNDPACMKCAGAHFSFECSKPRSLPATCINCNGAHPACFTGCSARPRRKPKQKNRQPRSATDSANRFLQIFQELQDLLKNEELVQLLRSLLPENKS